MKKFIIFGIMFVYCLFISGCNENTIVLTCKSDDYKTVTTIQDNRIVKINENGKTSKVSKSEWEEIKDFYEFKDNVSGAKIARTLKKKNEENGFTCSVK